MDAVLLQQVLVNLLDNADKYSPAGLPIDIAVESSSLGLSIDVADCGPGVPEELRQQIFDKFFQIHSESAHGGVGLGLSICRAIVAAHGGEILVTDRSGGGSVFEVHLPLLESPAYNRTGRTEVNTLKTAKPLILLIEDNPPLSGKL